MVVLALTSLTVLAQVPGGAGPTRSGAKAEAVQYLYPEQITVPAGEATPGAMHFRVAQGLHINSPAPKGEFLIPTELSIPAASGVRLEAADYPAGTEFIL